jgi:hypothetical protein
MVGLLVTLVEIDSPLDREKRAIVVGASDVRESVCGVRRRIEHSEASMHFYDGF